METLLFVMVALYLIYLNIRIKDIEETTNSCILDNAELEIKLYNKMMEIRKDLKNEKSGRKPAKKRRRVPKTTIPSS
jgi:ferritin-like protein